MSMEAHVHVFDGKPRKVPERKHPFKFSKRVEDWMFFLWDDPCDLCGETTRETMVQVLTGDGVANYHGSCLKELADRIKKCDGEIESGEFAKILHETVKKMQ